jgi:hypothetical protein
MLLCDCKPLAWYLVVTCPDCKTRQAIIRDSLMAKLRSGEVILMSASLVILSISIDPRTSNVISTEFNSR